MKQKIAIVTAASMGIGASCARLLSKNGYNLVIMSRGEKIMALSQELGAIGVQGSVDNEKDLKTLVDITMGNFGRIDVVINNTGHPSTADILEITDAEWYYGLDLMFLNVVRMSRLVTPIMLNQGGGAIVNISTCFVNEPSANYPISSSFRAALANFTKLYSDQYAEKGIRMNNLLPGPTKEEATRIENIPIKRAATFDEIAKTAMFLVSDDASYIVGQNIRADGGRTRAV